MTEELTTARCVIFHRKDPDRARVFGETSAGQALPSVAEELPNGRLLQASSILELRLAPERLTGEIADFIDECWSGDRAHAAVA